MRRWVWIGAVAVAVAVAVGLGVILSSGTPRSGVAVIGDEGPAILEAAGWSQALPLSSAGVTVVSVDSWEKLRFIGDMWQLCGTVCEGEAGLVRIVELLPRGSRKVVLVNLSAWPRSGERPDFDCIADALGREARQIGAPATPASCAAGAAEARTRWALPFGLGLI